LLWSAGAILKGFEVDGFWPALWGSIVISISNAFMYWLLKPAQKVYQQ
jgi:putative membrane protein